MLNIVMLLRRSAAQLFLLLSSISFLLGGSLASAQVVLGGPAHTVVLKADGTVWGWGYNSNGQLGNGTSIDSYTPVQATGLTAVKAVAVGYGHTVALKFDGTIWAWGINAWGQLGNGSLVDSYTPVQVTTVGQVYVSIAAGRAHTIALRSDGTVWTWGYNSNGQLGYVPTNNPATTNTQGTTPKQVPGLTGVISIFAGSEHSIAMTGDGKVWAWGANPNGQLGNCNGTGPKNPDPKVVDKQGNCNGQLVYRQPVDSATPLLVNGL